MLRDDYVNFLECHSSRKDVPYDESIGKPFCILSKFQHWRGQALPLQWKAETRDHRKLFKEKLNKFPRKVKQVKKENLKKFHEKHKKFWK